VEPRVVRLTAAILAGSAVALAGCGTDGRAARGSAAPLSQQAPDAQRTQDLVPLTTAQAARRADRIALVVSHGSRVIEGAPGTPFTRTTFAVQDVLKGDLPRKVVVQVIGGRLGDTVVTSPVQAFARSSRYILFLGPDSRVGPTIFPQSVLEVKRAAGTDVVQPAPNGIRLRGARSSKPRLHDVLFSLRRYLRTTGGSP
jgi:hypothetical protein